MGKGKRMEIVKQKIEDVPDEKRAGSDGIASPLRNVYLDKGHGELIASNGIVVAYLPVKTDAADISQHIPPFVFRAARREKTPEKGIKARLFSLANGFKWVSRGLSVWLHETEPAWTGHAPVDYDKFRPEKRPARDPDMILDAVELKRLADALFESRTKPQPLALYLKTETRKNLFGNDDKYVNALIYPEPDEKNTKNNGRGYGLLMGCRIERIAIETT